MMPWYNWITIKKSIKQPPTREVVEPPTDAEIIAASFEIYRFSVNDGPQLGFQVGARWMKSKMEGKDE